MTFRLRDWHLGHGLGIAVLFLGLGMAANRIMLPFLPSFGPVTVTLNDRPAFEAPMPLSINNMRSRDAHVRVEMHLPHPAIVTTFLIGYTDELSNVAVNGQSLEAGPFVRLKGIVTTENVIEADLHTEGTVVSHIFDLIPSQWNWPFGLRTLALILLGCVAAWVLARRMIGVLDRPLFWVLLGGTVLRVLYAGSTRPSVRAYDWVGHAEYIQSLALQFSLPPSGSWESQQPPLYHLLAAPLWRVGQFFGFTPQDAWMDVQLLSILLSILTLLVGMRIVLHVVSDGFERVLACVLLAVFPTLVYLSAQINNDVLLTCIGFLWLESLLTAWRSGRSGDWAWTAAWAAIGILTKANAVLFMAATIACIPIASLSFKNRLRSLFACVVGLLLASTFSLWRLLNHGTMDPVANATTQNPVLMLNNPIANFLTFHPLQMLLHPYVSGAFPESRPQFFLEAMVKTSQFGSFWFGPDSAIVLLLFLFLLPVAAYGCVRMSQRQHVALIIVVLTLCAGLLAFRFRYPFTSSQNFRYVQVLALPFALITAHGARSLRLFPLRALSEVLILSYATVAYAFFLSVALVS